MSLFRTGRLICWFRCLEYICRIVLQRTGTVLPMFLLPEVVWTSFPFGLALEGRTIVNNLALIEAVLLY